MSDSKRPLLLVFPFNLLSHYLRCLELAKHLSNDFEIEFAYSRNYCSFIEKEGFSTFPCKNLDAVEVMECAKNFDFSWINEKNLKPVLEDQVKIIREKRPFAVLGDTLPTLKMAAEIVGVLYISLMNGYMSKHYSFVRKLSRTHPAYKYSKKVPASVFDFITIKAEAFSFVLVHKPFKRLRKLYNLSKKRNYLDELEGDINLVCDLPKIFPQKNFPLNYLIIPPLFFNSPDAQNVKLNLDSGKKTIFVSMGSTGDWKKVEFLNDRTFYRFNIVTAADNDNILNAPHIIKRAFVNIHDIFPFTDVVVCHGGNGTIYQALSYGIPILCKTTHFEQEWNVHGLERLGLGQSLDEVKSLEQFDEIIAGWIEKKGRKEFFDIKQEIASGNWEGISTFIDNSVRRFNSK